MLLSWPNVQILMAHIIHKAIKLIMARTVLNNFHTLYTYIYVIVKI